MQNEVLIHREDISNTKGVFYSHPPSGIGILQPQQIVLQYAIINKPQINLVL